MSKGINFGTVASQVLGGSFVSSETVTCSYPDGSSRKFEDME